MIGLTAVMVTIYIGHDFSEVINNNDSGIGSLRFAVDAVNASGAGVVVFDEESPDFRPEWSAYSS